MFSVPYKKSATDVPSSFALTASGTTAGSSYFLGGRINLNSAIVPFMSSSGSSIVRDKPLESILLGAGCNLMTGDTLSATTSGSIRNAIMNFTPATGTNLGNQYGFPYYLSRGELAEVDQIATNGEASEELLRNTVDLVTTRSNVFQIYSVGQSIKQLPSGKVIIVADKRVETLVSSGTNGTTLTPFYSRNLNP
jgi:hypothetical protein